MEQAGFSVEIQASDRLLQSAKEEHEVPVALQSCHTAIVDGYVIEGHVPPADVERLLAERPDVIGLAVPGMPIGSPGMEVEGQAAQPYDVFAFAADGTIRVWSSYDK